jgi:hypothetical protein
MSSSVQIRPIATKNAADMNLARSQPTMACDYDRENRFFRESGDGDRLFDRRSQMSE